MADTQREKLREDAKAMRASLQFVKLEHIDEEIDKLENRISHTTLSIDEVRATLPPRGGGAGGWFAREETRQLKAEFVLGFRKEFSISELKSRGTSLLGSERRPNACPDAGLAVGGLAGHRSRSGAQWTRSSSCARAATW